MVLEKAFASPLDCKEIKPVNPKKNQSWILERLMLKLKLQYFDHLVWRADSLEKTVGQEEKGTTEDEMVGWHHRLDGHEFGLNSGSWWWTGRPGVLRFMGSQRVGHDRATELNLFKSRTDLGERLCTIINLIRKWLPIPVPVPGAVSLLDQASMVSGTWFPASI